MSNAEVLLTMDWAATLQQVVPGHKRVLLLASAGAKNRGTLDAAITSIGASLALVITDVPALPDMDYVTKLHAKLQYHRLDSIVALGGGSVIDVAKACVLSQSCESPSDLREQIQTGEITRSVSSPIIIAIPTTAGSGSESTSFATIWDRNDSIKRSIQSPGLMPRYAIIDHNLLRTLNGHQLLYPALDAASHAIESLWSRRRTLTSRLNAITALNFTAAAFERMSVQDIDSAFEPLSLASLFAGRAIAESRSAIAHSISYPLTLEYGVPHGLAVSFSLAAISNVAAEHFDTWSMEWRTMSRVIGHLPSLELKAQMAQYCDLEAILALVPRMMTPGRSDNFLAPLNYPTIREIIVESMLVTEPQRLGQTHC